MTATRNRSATLRMATTRHAGGMLASST
jgi:hypothetical protein